MNRGTSLAIGGLAAILGFLSPQSAYAQEKRLEDKVSSDAGSTVNNQVAAKAHYDKGLEFFKAKNYEKAISEYVSSVQLNDSDDRVHYSLGHAYRNQALIWLDDSDKTNDDKAMKYIDSALSEFSHAIELHEKSGQKDFVLSLMYVARARVKEKLGDKDGAIADCQTSLQIRDRQETKDYLATIK